MDPDKTTPTAAHELRSFLEQRFSSDELRVLVMDHLGEEAARALAGDVSGKKMSVDVAMLLLEHGAIDEALFGRLTSARPRFTDEIEALRRAYLAPAVEFDFDQAVGPHLERYRSFLAERYDAVQILGMPKATRLSRIYTRVRILDEMRARRQAGPVVLAMDRTPGSTVTVDGPSRDANEVLREHERLVLLGKPGAGKTSFSRHITLHALAGISDRKRVPIFVELRKLNHDETRRSDAIQRHLALELESGGFPPSALQGLLRGRHVLLILDGLDEVSDRSKDLVVQELLDLSARHPGNQIVVSCRTAAYGFWLENFTTAEIADFTRGDVETFATQWFHDNEALAREFLRELGANPYATELAATPLLLTLLCLEYESTESLSTTRAQIYHNAIDVLLLRWDASRRIKRDDTYRRLTKAQKEQILQYIAACSFEDNHYLFRRNLAESWIRAFCEGMSPRQDGDPPSAADVLDALMAHHGLIIERYKDTLSFLHLTFQEYLTAAYIVARGDSAWRPLVRQHLADTRWREVLVLTACLLPDPTEYLLEVLSRMTELGFTKQYFRMIAVSRDHEASSIVASRTRLKIDRARPVYQGPGARVHLANPGTADVAKHLRSWRQKFVPFWAAQMEDEFHAALRGLLSVQDIGRIYPHWSPPFPSPPSMEHSLGYIEDLFRDLAGLRPPDLKPYFGARHWWALYLLATNGWPRRGPLAALFRIDNFHLRIRMKLGLHTGFTSSRESDSLLEEDNRRLFSLALGRDTEHLKSFVRDFLDRWCFSRHPLGSDLEMAEIQATGIDAMLTSRARAEASIEFVAVRATERLLEVASRHVRDSSSQTRMVFAAENVAEVMQSPIVIEPALREAILHTILAASSEPPRTPAPGTDAPEAA